jgi:hypothetical protein
VGPVPRIVKTIGICVLLLIGGVSAYANDCELEQGTVPVGGISFVRQHRVYESTDGFVDVVDQLVVWDQQPGSTCFFVTTVHRNLHYCWLLGRAERQRSGTYTYQDDSCRVDLDVSGNRAKMRVTDPTDVKRKGCNPKDSQEFVCGMNTDIPSAIYTKESRKAGGSKSIN